MVWIKRLGDKIIGPFLHRLDGPLDGTVGGDHHHWDVVAPPANLFQHLEPVHVGHLVVEKDKIGVEGIDFLEGLCTVNCSFGGVTFVS